MLISEHKVGAEVDIAVSVNGNKAEFKTVVSQQLSESSKHHKTAIVCDAIYKEDKVLSFKGLHCVVTIKGADDRYYTYNICVIGMCTVDNEKKIVIYSNDDVKPKNFREAYRYPISVEAIIRTKENHGTTAGYLKNISQTGIAFTINKSSTYIPKVGDECSLSFKYEETQYNIKCTVVRTETIEDEFRPIFIGATLSGYTAHCQNLIAKLAVKEARLRREAKDETQAKR